LGSGGPFLIGLTALLLQQNEEFLILGERLSDVLDILLIVGQLFPGCGALGKKRVLFYTIIAPTSLAAALWGERTLVYTTFF
jgi:hypothetical protein